MLTSPWAKGKLDARAIAAGGSDVAEGIKRILLVGDHNAFREALAMRLNQEDDLEVA